MGAWGTSLYANDSASDLRGDYVDKLRRGQSNEEITLELISNNQEIMGDVEEEPLFWFALADTQWNYGRLLPEVKEKALYFLDRDEELERWKDSGEKKFKAWINTLEKLREKLLSPPPPEKKVSRYRFYQCKWQLGDVFAYQFTSDYSKERGVFGQYIIFRKITESDLWPGHMIPTVIVYQWIGNEIPPLDQIKDLEVLRQGYYPREYLFNLLTESERAIPKDKLTYLGNIPGDDLYEYSERKLNQKYKTADYLNAGAFWKFFEEIIIDRYFARRPETA
jgi:hypothetical protein